MNNSGEATVINDRYEIHKRIGRGGMADVFLARDLLLDRQVAVKVLFPEFAIDPNFVERFRREAQAAANLSHPNIVNVYDWGKYSGTYFITMEYVQGRTLAEILRTNRQLTAKQAAEIASEVAAALGFAHEAGLAHRDIKPANILIGSNGQVKVADFGIARAMNAPTESNLTQAGAVMGTASYFSPEQAQGAQPDPRSDLYSLGIVMYEMVAGRPPFTGENPVSIAYKQVHDPPQPLNQIVADIPRPFEAIIAKLLAKDPKLRYPSAHALRDDLRRFRNGEQVQALVSAVAGSQARTAVDAGHGAADHRHDVVGAHAHRQPVGDADGHHGDGADHGPVEHGRVPARRLAGRPLLRGRSLPHRLVRAGGVRRPDRARRRWRAAVPGAQQGRLRDRRDHARRLHQPAPRRGHRRAAGARTWRTRSFPEENPVVAEDFVHRTDPPAGTLVTAGTVIKLYYRPTPDLVQIPNVAGRTLQEARDILGAEGFAIDEESEENELDIGLVIRTEPAGGERVRQDTRITIVVSGGPQQIAIPASVIGDSVDVATAAARQRAVRVRRRHRVAAGRRDPGRHRDRDPPGARHPRRRGQHRHADRQLGPRSGARCRRSSVSPRQRPATAWRRTTSRRRSSTASSSRAIPTTGSSSARASPPGTPVDRDTTVALVVGRATAPVTTTTTTTTTTTLPPETTVRRPRPTRPTNAIS